MANTISIGESRVYERFRDAKERFEGWFHQTQTNADFLDNLLDSWDSDLAVFVDRSVKTAHRIVAAGKFADEAYAEERNTPGIWSKMTRAYHYGARDILVHLLQQVKGDRRLEHIYMFFREDQKYAGLL
jgi:hypothetical protein